MLDGIVYRDGDTLPPDCPPPNATRPDGEVFYRFVASSPVDVSNEFKSAAEQGREDVDPCQGWAVSLFRPRAKAEAALAHHRRYPKFRNSRLCPITLTAEAGAIVFGPGKRARRNGHYAWWPARDFAIEEHLGDQSTEERAQ